MTPWLRGLDARDRALLACCALSPSCAPTARRFWLTITHAGGARASIGVCLASLLFPAVTLTTAWRALLLLGVSHAVVQLVKRTVGRPRPSAQLPIEAIVAVPDRFSFPSGHACAAMAVAVGFAAAFPTLTVPLLVLAWLIGFSRVMLGVHYPGDVLIGQAIALATAYPLLR
ncbi:MAG: phosphatase PAP2 family protein [Gemmatimonas sp.]|uniref:phosphatase PAP2 family protein n=1 Tax=Gemmatimonas sp. TaxID=1962908 RepID=UPI00391F9692|nr:phosphatase PAP2 family protein [Gemmatimonadota bacterium]